MNRYMLLLSLIPLWAFWAEPEFVNDPISKTEVVYLHNKERGQEDEDQLKIDHQLSVQAQQHAEWMARSGRLVHSRNGMGENIAMGQETETEVVDAWMGSRGHRANILDEDYTEIGIGYARLKDGRPYWCVVFGD